MNARAKSGRVAASWNRATRKFYPCVSFLSAVVALSGCSFSSNEAGESATSSKVEKDLNRSYEDVDLMFSFPHGSTKSEVSLRDAKGLLTSSEFAAVVANATTNISFNVDGVPQRDTSTEELFKKRKSDVIGACVHDISSWKVVALRFAPYEIAVPGPKEPALAWGKNNGSDLAKIMQLRMSLRPFCKEDGKTFARDMAMHLVFEIAPEDAAQRAKYFQAQAFAKSSLAGDQKGADAALQTHAEFLASDDYAQFRKGVLADHTAVAMARFRDQLDAKVDVTFRQKLETLFTKRGSVFPKSGRFELTTQITDPYLLASDSFVRKALNDFVTRYARRSSLRGVTTMFGAGFGEGGSPWIFKSNAVAADGVLRSNVESTMFSSFAEGKSLRLVASGRVDSGGLAFASPSLDGQSKAAFDSQVVLVNNEDFMVGGDADTLDFNARDAEFTKQFMRKSIDPNFNQPTSTSCDTCHLASETFELSDDGKSLKASGGGYNLHMLSHSQMNLRSLSEARHEAALLNAETGGYIIKAGVDLRDVSIPVKPDTPVPRNATCTVTDPADTFALVREGSAKSNPRASMNVGTVLNTLGTNAAMLQVDRVAFIHESTVACLAVGGLACGQVKVISTTDNSVVKGADGKTYVTGANLRMAAGGSVFGVGAVGARFAVMKKTGSWYQIALRGNMSPTRCK